MEVEFDNRVSMRSDVYERKRREEVHGKKDLIILGQEPITCFSCEERVLSYGQCWGEYKCGHQAEHKVGQKAH